MSSEPTPKHFVEATNAKAENNQKVCPKCKRRFDSALAFCLDDGRALLTPLQSKEPVTLVSQNSRTDNHWSKTIVRVSVLIFLLGTSIFVWLILRVPNQAAETSVSVDRAMISLDLTSSWVELNDDQRKSIKASKGILRGEFFGLRKFSDTATFGHRLGTTSNFTPEWYDDGIHTIAAEESKDRKCHPDTKYSYMLYFDISKEKANVPFNLNYEIDFWNAHNGLKGDWHSFYVSRPTNTLIIKVSFPKNKPYTKFFLKSAPGVDCNTHDFRDYPNPNVEEGVDQQTGAKTITWTIDAPTVQWIYEIGWEW
jgi:hypothetical protein